ncbi:hypothetical protein [Pantoea stewartii]|uniref:hypothetical protein n=1 Tax=Pantoea stewartii TaxID=66269 RepID=UPI0025A2FCE4|nr:hypothetical protein [Pantoea stewartii]
MIIGGFANINDEHIVDRFIGLERSRNVRPLTTTQSTGEQHGMRTGVKSPGAGSQYPPPVPTFDGPTGNDFNDLFVQAGKRDARQLKSDGKSPAMPGTQPRLPRAVETEFCRRASFI